MTFHAKTRVYEICHNRLLGKKVHITTFLEVSVVPKVVPETCFVRRKTFFKTKNKAVTSYKITAYNYLKVPPEGLEPSTHGLRDKLVNMFQKPCVVTVTHEGYWYYSEPMLAVK